MTEILKCPFCGSELENACAQVIYFCPNDECHKAKDWYASKQVWQALIDGKKAHDALDVAVYALKKYGGREPSQSSVEPAPAKIKVCKNVCKYKVTNFTR